VWLPRGLKPGHGIELSAAGVNRVLEAAASRSIILNRAEHMVMAGSVAPFRVPRRRSSSDCGRVNA
jgi:hypothetical protein